jgi:hypothetical protein
MAATVLNSEQTVSMSVFVVRAFVRLRQVLAANKEFANKIKELENKGIGNALGDTRRHDPGNHGRPQTADEPSIQSPNEELDSPSRRDGPG